MTTLKIFFASFTFTQIVGVLFAVIFYAWAVVSILVVVGNGGSFFEEKCKSGNDVIWKYSPPVWRKITLWVWRFEISLIILLAVKFLIHITNRASA
jgi:hypothetical protein